MSQMPARLLLIFLVLLESHGATNAYFIRRDYDFPTAYSQATIALQEAKALITASPLIKERDIQERALNYCNEWTIVGNG